MVRRVKWFCSFIYSLKPECAGRKLSVAAGRKPLGGKPALITVPHNNTQPLEAFAAQYGQAEQYAGSEPRR